MQFTVFGFSRFSNSTGFSTREKTHIAPIDALGRVIANALESITNFVVGKKLNTNNNNSVDLNGRIWRQFLGSFNGLSTNNQSFNLPTVSTQVGSDSNTLNEKSRNSMLNFLWDFFNKVFNILRELGPNHFIFQWGPQFHNDLIDKKFTSTFVFMPGLLRIFILHIEIGKLLFGSVFEDFFKKFLGSVLNIYGLSVAQIGFEINWEKFKVDWENCECSWKIFTFFWQNIISFFTSIELSYVREILGRIEADIPYGVKHLQFTLGFEAGITDKSRGFLKSIKHAIQDCQILLAQALSLVGANFLQNKTSMPRLIPAFAACLTGFFAVPKTVEILYEEDRERLYGEPRERESVIWLGLSSGYADLNWAMYKDLTNIDPTQESGMDIQVNAYLRNGQMFVRNSDGEWSAPPLIGKIIAMFYGGDEQKITDDFINAHRDVNNSNLDPRAAQVAHDCLSAAAEAVYNALDRNNSGDTCVINGLGNTSINT